MRKSYSQEILIKIKKKKCNIGVIGLGYVGLKLLIEFANKKIMLYGFDNDKNKVISLKKNKSPISYIENKTLKKIDKYTNFNTNYKNISKCDIIIICLPTPLNKKNEPDLSHIKNCVSGVKKYLIKGQTVILESTTYPGTTKEFIIKKLNNFKIGRDFFVGYSPERENPGSKDYTFWRTPKIVSGYTGNCLKIVNNLYSLIVKKTVKSKSIEISETSKIFENVYRSVNIALVNEMRFILKKFKIDINDVIDMAKTKPFGFSEFRPGPGVGGHCIPIDPLYLSWIAKKKGYKTQFIELASKINIATTRKIFEEIKKIMSKKRNKKILIVGMSYKKNIEDTRESAGIKLFEKLSQDFYVNFLDNLVNEVYINKKVFYSVEKDYSKIKKYGLVIICSDHDFYDYNKILKNSKLIVDLRNRYKLPSRNVLKI